VIDDYHGEIHLLDCGPFDPDRADVYRITSGGPDFYVTMRPELAAKMLGDGMLVLPQANGTNVVLFVSEVGARHLRIDFYQEPVSDDWMVQ
jgi:hypothetical protein